MEVQRDGRTDRFILLRPIELTVHVTQVRARDGYFEFEHARYSAAKAYTPKGLLTLDQIFYQETKPNNGFSIIAGESAYWFTDALNVTWDLTQQRKLTNSAARS